MKSLCEAVVWTMHLHIGLCHARLDFMLKLLIWQEAEQVPVYLALYRVKVVMAMGISQSE